MLPTILALDPGGTTGYCVYVPPFDKLDQGQIGPHEHHEELWQLMRKALAAANTAGTALIIVCERFEFRHEERSRDKIVYVSAEYIGVAKLFCRTLNVQLVLQSAAQAKQFFTDDVLKQTAVWSSGRKHAMDATRHYLYYRTFTLKDNALLRRLSASRSR